MPLDAKELAKEKELNRELSDEEMDRLLIPRRSVGTWATFALILVGLVVGGGYLFGARILKAGRDYAAEVAAVGTPEQRQKAQETLQNVNSKLTLWKLQHQGRMPSFEGHPDWEQFTQATDISGKLGPTRGMPVCGPYLAAKPVNPINQLSTVLTVEKEPVLGALLADGAKAGFVYCKSAGRFWVTDVAGTRAIDPSAPYENTKPAAKAAASAPSSTPSAAPAAQPAETPTAPAEKPATVPERPAVAPAKPAGTPTPAPGRSNEPTRNSAKTAPGTQAKPTAPAGAPPKAKK